MRRPRVALTVGVIATVALLTATALVLARHLPGPHDQFAGTSFVRRVPREGHGYARMIGTDEHAKILPLLLSRRWRTTFIPQPEVPGSIQVRVYGGTEITAWLLVRPDGHVAVSARNAPWWQRWMTARLEPDEQAELEAALAPP